MKLIHPAAAGPTCSTNASSSLGAHFSGNVSSTTTGLPTANPFSVFAAASSFPLSG